MITLQLYILMILCLSVLLFAKGDVYELMALSQLRELYLLDFEFDFCCEITCFWYVSKF